MDFETMLTGGHPNSLGRTLEVVDMVLKDQTRLPDLLACYTSSDEVVRLRTSNALKGITIEHPEWVATFLDRLILEVAKINQASTQWTLPNTANSSHCKPFCARAVMRGQRR